MRRIVTSKITKTILNTMLMIVIGGMLSLVFAFGSRADQTLHTSNDAEIPSGQDLAIDQNTTIVIDGNKSIEQITINGACTLTIQGNDTDELSVKRISDSGNGAHLIMESGRLIISADYTAIFLFQNNNSITIKGGYVSAIATMGNSDGIRAENISISGGEVVAKGPAIGINAATLTLSGGKVYGEVYGDGNSEPRSGIGVNNLIISGGEITAKSSYNGNSDYTRNKTLSIYSMNEPILSNGMKITEPENGAFEYLDFGAYGGARYVIKDGDNKMVTVVIKKESSETNTPSQKTSASKNNSTDNRHTHSYSWVVTKYPTSISDGEEAYMCSCGDVARTSILPAISAFEEEVINKIKNAPANGVIEVETRLFNSFGIGVRDALVSRPDVTLKVSFLSEGYRGQLLKVTIPTGIDRYALWDEKGWLGLCRAGSTLGYDK